MSINLEMLNNIPPEQLLKVAIETIMKPSKETKAQTVGAPIGPYLHGPGGLFGVLGLEQPIISTHTNIVESVAADIPVKTSNPSFIEGTNELNPYCSYITGFLRSDQQEKNAVCDDPEEAGSMKTCIQTTAYGRKEFKTRQVEINRIGQSIRRGEFMDNRIVNSPLVSQLGGMYQMKFGLDNPTSLAAGEEMAVRLLEVGVAYQRWFCPQVYTGNPANSSAGGGYKEFPGLDIVIGRAKIDAISGQACPSLYSTVMDFNYNDVQDVNAANNMIRLLKSVLRYLNHKAIQQNAGPLVLKLAMRGNLFDALVDVWPCGYATDRCQTQESNAGLNVTVNDLNGTRMRDDMRNGSYLLVDGRKIFVIKDDCITEETAADNGSVPGGAYSSDIYILPYAIRGGAFRTLYWEFYDYSLGTMPAVQDAHAIPFFWSDSGRFMWSIKSPDNWCLEVISKVEPRLRLLTPQFAARITNVVYVPDYGLHYDDPLPTSSYWLDGGNPTGYPGPSPYAEWNTTGPGGW